MNSPELTCGEATSYSTLLYHHRTKSEAVRTTEFSLD